LAKFGDAQAAFAAPLPPLFVNDYRVDQDQLGAGIFLEGYIHDGNSLRNADLRSRQPDAARRVHRLKHIFHQLLELVVEASHFRRRFFQHRVAELHNWINHFLNFKFVILTLSVAEGEGPMHLRSPRMSFQSSSSSAAPDSRENFVSFLSSNPRRISRARSAPV